jgi:hypothetical protein
MKKLLYILLMFAGCACTRQQTVVYDLEPFENVEIYAFGIDFSTTDVDAETVFSQQATYQMIVQKSEKDSIYWQTENNTLSVILFSRKNPKLTICAPNFKSIDCNCRHIKTQDTIKQSYLKFSAQLVKNADLQFNTDTLIMDMDLYKKVKLSGYCDTASIEASFSGLFSKFDARKLEINNLQIVCGSSFSHTWLHVNNHLWITEGRNCKIDYYGRPEVKQANIKASTLRGR